MQHEHVDVLIVGAGISGIGIAAHLHMQHPQRRVVILEAREHLGGTWDLFRYPGIRSDSDLATFGYAFKPWTNKNAIAAGDLILDYLRETADEYAITERIRFGHRVLGATWSTDERRWTIRAQRTDTGEELTFTASWLVGATGYYRYDRGYLPELPGRDRFTGTLVHPQAWPEDLDCAGKRVVVIGSGATAVTIIPTVARTAAHVTMLQRSPTYVMSLPAVDRIAVALRRVLGDRRGHALTRRKNVAIIRGLYGFSRRHPAVMRALIRLENKRRLPKGYDVDRHFKPSYDPWDQRLCLTPDGELFKAISSGQAEVVTDRIDTFTEAGIRLVSGRELAADIVVTATGLELQAFGGIEVVVDGEPVNVPERMAYKGMMLTGVPNFAFALGYTNASWTLKVDLIGEHLCRLLTHMDGEGAAVAIPQPQDPALPTKPLLDFAAGYVQRAIDDFPRQGVSAPWEQSMDYRKDVAALRHGPVDDHMRFLNPGEYGEPAGDPVGSPVPAGITPTTAPPRG